MNDYIKCGVILLSPSEQQCILKCSDCNELYSELDLFLIHFFDNHNEEKEPQDGDDVAVTAVIKYNNEEADPLTINVKQERVSENEDLSSEENVECEDNIESDNESIESGKRKTSTFVRDFMKSEKKVLTLISAYENQPLLWNTNLSLQIRPMDRPYYLQEIARDLKEKMNVKITNDQVAAVISRLRREYRNKLNRNLPKEKCGASQRKPLSPMRFFESLDFLRPFLQINSLTNFDSLQPELKPQQVLKILGIYKKFPHLWNADLIEYVCKNKRQEALVQMQNAIESEMGLKTNENSLKRYIYSIHIHFAREKRRNMANDTTEETCEYFQYVTFLLDHVAPFKCSECDREFQSPLILKIHNSQHDGLKTLTCSLCNKEYKTVEAYTFHGKRHMNDLKEVCDECGKKFMRLADLNIHKRSHTGDTPYCCEICGASYRYSQELTTHRRRHKKQYVHKCPTCSKGFYEKERMKAHMKTHSNIRDYACSTCGKAFKLRKTMKQHEFIHEEGRKHLCTLCGKAFKNKIGLSHHMRTHRRKVAIDESDLNPMSIFNT